MKPLIKLFAFVLLIGCTETKNEKLYPHFDNLDAMLENIKTREHFDNVEIGFQNTNDTSGYVTLKLQTSRFLPTDTASLQVIAKRALSYLPTGVSNIAEFDKTIVTISNEIQSPPLDVTLTFTPDIYEKK